MNSKSLRSAKRILEDVPSPTARPGTAIDRDVFVHQLERIRLTTLRTIARVRPEQAVAGLEVDLARCERMLAAAAAAGPTRASRLAERLGLDADELGFLWFCVALTADPLLLPHAVVLGGSDMRRGATLALYATVEDLSPHRVSALSLKMGAAHPLLRFALLETEQGEHVPTSSPFRAPRRLCRHLAGEDALDDAVAAAGGLVAVPDPVIATAEEQDLCEMLARTLGGPQPSLLVVQGADGVGRRTLVARAAGLAGQEAVAIDVRRLGTAAGMQAALAALRRESLLRGSVPVVAGVEDLGSEGPEGVARQAALQRFIDDVDFHVALVTTGEGVPVLHTRPMVRAALAVPAAEIRREAWEAALGDDAGDLEETLERVSVRYRMGVGGINAAIGAARAAAHGRGGALGAGDLIEGVRVTVGDRFGDLAQHLDVPQRDDDLVLPDDVREQVDLVVARAHHAYQVLETWGFRNRASRGGGLAVLLSGPPGTGKTMLAGLLARSLDLDLYQVDLSKIVSKWIGETEKNLSRVLDAAAAGHALLLFDEADALFARRTEVRGSNDRYANLEVSHLLQRIDAFGGVAVLTTNLDSSLDPALRRRLAAHIVFPKPAREERVALWQRLLTQRAPIAPGIDFQKLAREYPDLTGGTIRNAVMSAAYLAASQGSAIGHEHLEHGARNEYRAMGRILLERTTDKR